MATLLGTFRQRAEAAQSHVIQVGGWDEVITFAASLNDDVLIAPQLVTQLSAAGFSSPSFRAPEAADPVRSAADAPVGLVRGELAIAETGSVLLVEPDLADRAVSMLCHTLVEAVPADRLVAGLEDFAAWLTEHAAASGYATLTTGPSRTADIERSLTIGVQGPRELYVVVVG